VDHLSREMLERIARVEGVRAVTAVNRVPLNGRMDQHAAWVNGTATPLSFNWVDERYFDVLGLQVIAGRSFTRQEAELRVKVAVISAATARKLWQVTAATLPAVLGRTLELPAEPGEDPRNAGVYQVIGVAPDVVSGWIFEGQDATLMYLPAAAGAQVVDSAMAHVAGNAPRVGAAIRKACAEGGQTAAGCEPASLREGAAMQRFPFQAAAAVAGVLGALALVLTGIGLYGVVSYSVVQRRREIGVHVALGALPSQVMGRILGEAGRCVAGGLAVGLPVCALLSKLAASSVFQIRTFDLASYVAVPAMLAAIAMLACFGPALRAARMDAMRSLREE